MGKNANGWGGTGSFFSLLKHRKKGREQAGWVLSIGEKTDTQKSDMIFLGGKQQKKESACKRWLSREI